MAHSMLAFRSLKLLAKGGSRVNSEGVVTGALATHQSGPGSIPARWHMWVEFVVGYCLCSEQFEIPIRPAWKPARVDVASTLNIAI